jgi:hypothetical protein
MVSIGDGADEHSFTLSYTCPTLDRFYRALVTRNANVLRLYVNGLLRDERTDLPSGDITLAAYISSTTWKLGTEGNNGGIWNAVRTDEVDLYDYALTATDELEIYESALASLPVSATINVRVVVELDTNHPG